MGTTIIFRRGENDPTSGSGLTLAEPAFNTTLKTFHIGLGHGVTAAWVGAPISGLSADIAAGITYKIPTASAVKNYIGGLCYGNTGAATITQYVSSFNGLTGAVQGVSSVNGFTGAITVSGGTGISLNSSSNSITVNTTVLPTNTFALDRKHLLMAGTTNGNSSLLADNNLVYKPNLRTLGAKNSLSISGLDANYGEVNTIQLSGNTASGINVYTATNTVTLKVAADGDFTRLTFETGNEENLIETLAGTITFADYLTDSRTYYLPDASGTVALTSQLMGAVNGSTAATTAVTSFNGLTGSVGGVCAAQTNTFTALQSFASGISASGITVGGSMTVTGNLTVSGGVTFTISENVLIEDNIIILNSNVTGSPSENAGIEIERGTSANVQLLWNESSDKWTFTNDGSTYYDLPTSIVTSFNGLTGAVQGVSAAVAGTGISVSGATGAVTITNTGVQSFNGLTGSVGGVCAAQANTFTALQTFSSGLTATGITTGTITNSSSISVTSKGGTVTLKGITSGTALVANSISLSPLTTTNLSLNSATGIVDVNRGWEGVQSAYSSGLKFVNYDESFYYSNTLLGNASADRTIYLPDASGTLALTSQLMGAVNGSTAATTAVTSFNGRTGAVQGVSAAVAGTGISVSGATGSVTITNIGVQSFNGLTGAVTGVASIRGLTGAVGITNGTGIGLSVSGQTMTFSNTGVLSIDGSTGAITNVARTNVDNNFSSAQTIDAPGAYLEIIGSAAAFILTPGVGIEVSDSFSSPQTLRFNQAGTTTTVTLPNYTTTLAGLSGNQTFTALNTFSAGISAAGATLSSNTTIPSGSTLTVNGNFVANGNVNLGDAVTDAITVTGVLAANGGLSAAGATFASNIIVNTMTVGRGNTSGAVSNTALGVSVLAVNSGTFNTGVGNSALTANTTGGSNTAVGRRALFANTTGSSNTAIGPSALGAVTGGVFNTAIGSDSLSSTLVSNSTAVGAGSIQFNQSGNYNTAVGAFAGSFWGEGSTASISANQLQTGTGGVYIGYYARGSTFNQTNEIVIGANAVGGGSNTAVIGATSQVSATIYGLVNAPSGISASGGVTFGGTVASDTGYRITSNAIKEQTGTTYTFLESDNGKIVTFNSGSAVTVTIPTGLPTGFNCTAVQLGAGQVGFTAASGLTMNSYGNQYRLIGQHASASIIEYTANTVNLSGNLVV